MIVGEMKPLPRRAGVAQLQFGTKGTKRTPPFCSGTRIVLPADPEAEFFPLQDGQQFVYASKKSDEHYNPRSICFGGTDGQYPFLTPITGAPFLDLLDRGERGFFRALKPERIAALEKMLQIPSQRQGDIWVIRVPVSWKDIRLASIMMGDGEAPEFGELTIRRVTGYRLFGTNHRLDGMCAAESYGMLIFLRGIVTAPHHAPLRLHGPHAVNRTPYLLSGTD